MERHEDAVFALSPLNLGDIEKIIQALAMLLVAVAALRLGVPWKARSIATFGW